MSVSAVDIRKMRVFVRYGDMAMPMIMRLVIAPVEIVRVLVVFVMGMLMTVLHRLMHVSVLKLILDCYASSTFNRAYLR